jgi:hypothetical protein
MKRREHEDIPQERDRGLDIPAEANRDKHINYLEAEDRRDSNAASDSDSPFYIPNSTPLKDQDTEGGNRA